MPTITLTSFNYNVPPSANQVLDMKWRLASDPDVPGSYTALPTVTVAPNGVILSPSPYNIVIPAASVVVVSTNTCNSTDYAQTFTPSVITWDIDTYTCEQDEVFTEDSQITGLSSPVNLMYDGDTARMYGIDADNVNGPFFWYLPSATVPGGFTYKQSIIAPGGNKWYYSSAIDPDYRRLYACGRDTGGVNVYDLATDTVSVVPFGTDGVNFNRQFIKVFDTRIICTDNGTSSLTVIDRASLSVISTTAFSAIPSGTSCLYGSPTMTQVGTEIWVSRNNSSTGISSPNIFCYNNDFTTLIRTIDISANCATVSPFSVYVKIAWFVNGFYYILDNGSNKLIKVDPTSHIPTVAHTFNNRGAGFNYTGVSLVIDPVSGDTFLSGRYYVALANPSFSAITYKWDFTTDSPTYIYPDISFLNLTQVASTNELHGPAPGATAWEGGSWSTDGIITKYTR